MNLIKTSLFNAVAVIVKTLTLLGLNKVLAVYVGPSGYAVIGNFQSALQIITTFASGAVNVGVVKYTAEYHNDENRQHQVWRNAGVVSIFGSAIAGCGVSANSKILAEWLLKDSSRSSVFNWFALSLVFFVFNGLLLAILNGKKQIGNYVICNIFGSLLSLTITSLFAMRFGLNGALTALAINQSFAFIVTLFICYKSNWFRLRFLFGKLDLGVISNLSKYTAMALTSAVCGPVSHILIRGYLTKTMNGEFAGYWEAMWRISSAWLLFVTTTLSFYYLPRLAEIKDEFEIKKEIIQAYKMILPIVAIFSFFIYLLRDFIINSLFTSEFMIIRDLFALQMLGDTIKIGSWLIAYVLIGKAETKIFILSEIVFAVVFCILTCGFVSMIGLKGVALAHVINYVCYWIVVAFLVFKCKLNFRR
jgi:PST family polysaccharide transporter